MGFFEAACCVEDASHAGLRGREHRDQGGKEGLGFRVGGPEGNQPPQVGRRFFAPTTAATRFRV